MMIYMYQIHETGKWIFLQLLIMTLLCLPHQLATYLPNHVKILVEQIMTKNETNGYYPSM